MTGLLVVDASAILTLCFEDEKNDYGQRVLDAAEAGASIIVPAVWPLEVVNGLAMAERRGRLTPDALVRFMALLKDLVISFDQQSLQYATDTILPFARKYRLTVYDAAYLELTVREGALLASLDEPLIEACRAAGGHVI